MGVMLVRICKSAALLIPTLWTGQNGVGSKCFKGIQVSDELINVKFSKSFTESGANHAFCLRKLRTVYASFELLGKLTVLPSL